MELFCFHLATSLLSDVIKYQQNDRIYDALSQIVQNQDQIIAAMNFMFIYCNLFQIQVFSNKPYYNLYFSVT